MRVFDVFVNDEKVCRAGVGRDGVLNTIVTWVKLTGAAAKEARRQRAPVDETRLHVGGLSNETHQHWVERTLATGDRVTVAVATSTTADAPSHRHKRNDRQDEDRERQYFLQLKKKYEPSGVRPSDDPLDQTAFLNVDLDIRSRAPLDDLVNAFGRRVVVLYVGREGHQYAAHLELAISAADADRTIERFVTLVTGLPRAARRLWQAARTREFNVGVQAGNGPHAFALRLRPATLQSAAKIGAHIAFTVYAPGTTNPSA